MNCLEISSISSACGKNKYEPMYKTMLIQLCKSNKEKYITEMKNIGIIKDADRDEVFYDEKLKGIYNNYKKRVIDTTEFNNIETEIISKIVKEDPTITTENINHIQEKIKNNLKKDCGTNNEKTVIDVKRYKKGNNRMWYYTNENGWSIRGLHDASENEMVIEIKTRMKQQNVRKNEYDLYQLFGYLLAMNKTKGKIVQKYNDVIYDSENETDIEYGIIDIKEDKWRNKFDTFIKELNEFFDKMYNTAIFPYEKVFQKRKNLIEIKENQVCKVSPEFERLSKVLFT